MSTFDRIFGRKNKSKKNQDPSLNLGHDREHNDIGQRRAGNEDAASRTRHRFDPEPYDAYEPARPSHPYLKGVTRTDFQNEPHEMRRMEEPRLRFEDESSQHDAFLNDPSLHHSPLPHDTQAYHNMRAAPYGSMEDDEDLAMLDNQNDFDFDYPQHPHSNERRMSATLRPEPEMERHAGSAYDLDDPRYPTSHFEPEMQAPRLTPERRAPEFNMTERDTRDTRAREFMEPSFNARAPQTRPHTEAYADPYPAPTYADAPRAPRAPSREEYAPDYAPYPARQTPAPHAGFRHASGQAYQEPAVRDHRFDNANERPAPRPVYQEPVHDYRDRSHAYNEPTHGQNERNHGYSEPNHGYSDPRHAFNAPAHGYDAAPQRRSLMDRSVAQASAQRYTQRDPFVAHQNEAAHFEDDAYHSQEPHISPSPRVAARNRQMTARDEMSGHAYPETRVENEQTSFRFVIAITGLVTLSAVAFGAYRWMSDATSNIPPVLQASTTPYKVRPDTPGGSSFPYQDKLVYDRLLPQTEQKPEVERLLPAPDTLMIQPPEGLDPVMANPADGTVPAYAPANNMAAPQPAEPQNADGQNQGGNPAMASYPAQPTNQPMNQQVGQLNTQSGNQSGNSSGNQPVMDASMQAAALQSQSPTMAQAPQPGQLPANSMAASPAPELRVGQNPATITPMTAVDPAKTAASAPAAAGPSNASSSAETPLALPSKPQGDYSLQLGTLPTKSKAETEQKRLERRHKMLKGRLQTMSVVLPNKSVAYRIITNTTVGDKKEAAAFCTVLGGACKPVARK